MDAEVFNGLVEVSKNSHAAMCEQGFTTVPHLYVVDGSRLVARVQVRPMHVGEDALTALGEMSTLVAAAEADELLLVWETHDIATACDLAPFGVWPCLNILTATATGHVLHRFPYTEARAGVLPDGRASVKPLWRTPLAPVPGAELFPPVRGVVDYAFVPFEGAAAGRMRAAGAYLESEGYTVNFFEPA
ncbi:hypothetical protein ACIQF6_27915 [Kitasatospora sp. NPDC092948]|uniref:hypothetical protein n=1 Tax=Kitasatospora sp. NPDC092948 TaxID=3364088 RepID=UPI00380026FC